MGEGLMLPCPKIVRGQQELTPEQRAYAHDFGHAHIAAVLSTSPIDEQEAEAHLRDAYRVAMLPPPTTIRWFDSPPSFVQASMQEYMGNNVKDRVENAGEHMAWYGGPRLLASIDARVGGSLWNSVRTCISGGGRGGLRGVMCRHVANHVSSYVWDSMEERVGKHVWDRIQATRGMHSVVVQNPWSPSWIDVHPFMRACVAAYSEAIHFAFHWLFHEILEENTLIHLARFNELVSGYWLGKEKAWLVRRPVVLQRDEQGRLHHASGPCVQYRDGWGCYAWHGITVPEQIIMHPEQLTLTDWVMTYNVEIRRAIQEQLGPQRFIKLVGGKTLERGKHGNLIEINLPGDPERVAHYVQVQDSSTEQQYYLRVPPSINSADEAIAWTFGMNAREYQPGQET